MTDFKRNPRVLIVTPEVAYLPHGMDNVADYLTAKASGLADVSAALINALFEQGADVYVSIPDYRSMFNGPLPPALRRDLRMSKIRVPKERLHLAEDSAFFYLHGVYSNYWWENRRRALAFQWEIINTVSSAFLREVAGGRYGFVPDHVQQELASKISAGCAVGILNAPDPSFNPTIDKSLAVQYGPQDHAEGKKKNKRMLQKSLSLIQDDRAPLFFWPSPLNTVHQGCQLLADILYNVVAAYWAENLEIVFVAGGAFQKHFKDIVQFHNLGNHIAVCNYNERLSRLAYAASDFVLMASSFGLFGLPQMISPIYGSLPVTYDTGNIHDAVSPLDVKNNTGSGFIFEVYNSQGLFWAIRQAMKFYKLPAPVRQKIVGRIMTQSAGRFNHMVTARRYIELYEKMLQRPLINSGRGT